MLEGKELEGKIGKYGSYGVDVADDGSATGDIELAVDQQFLGFITVRGSGKFSVRADLLDAFKGVVKKNGSAIMTSLGSKLTNIFHKAKDVSPGVGNVAENNPAGPAATEIPADPASNLPGAVPVQPNPVV